MAKTCLPIRGSYPWWVRSLLRELRSQCLRPEGPECRQQKQYCNKFNNSIKALKLKRWWKQGKDSGGNSLVGQWLPLCIFTGSISDQGIKILQAVLCGKKKKKDWRLKNKKDSISPAKGPRINWARNYSLLPPKGIQAETAWILSRTKGIKSHSWWMVKTKSETPLFQKQNEKRWAVLKIGLSECLPKTKTKSHDIPWKGKRKKSVCIHVCVCLFILKKRIN